MGALIDKVFQQQGGQSVGGSMPTQSSYRNMLDKARSNYSRGMERNRTGGQPNYGGGGFMGGIQQAMPAQQPMSANARPAQGVSNPLMSREMLARIMSGMR